jgi:RND superfamily putative drug exporter
MRLTGRATWWAPRRLRALLNRFGLSEGGGQTAEVPRRDAERDSESVNSV